MNHKAIVRETRRLKRAAEKTANAAKQYAIERKLKAHVRQYDMAVNNAK